MATERSTPLTIRKWADDTGEFLEKITGFFCVICFVVMTVAALLGVFFRYAMKSPFMWTEELARFLLVWMGFVAISIALRRRRHIKIEILPKIAPRRVVWISGYLVDLLIAVFLIVFLRQGYLLVKGNIMMAATMDISMVWILLALPVSAVLAIIQLVLRFVINICSDIVSDPEKPIDIST